MFNFFTADRTRRDHMISSFVVSEPMRCVQCGICSFNCPQGINVRQYVWQRQAVRDRHCLSCGECIARCPRGVLRFERTHRFQEGD